MTITILYHVSVTVPEDVYEWRNTNVTASVWDHEVIFACLGNVGSGSYDYGEKLWADFHSRKEAERCEEFLNNLINRYKEKMNAEN